MVPECYLNAAGKHYGDCYHRRHYVYLKIFTHGSLLSFSGGLHFWSVGNTHWVLTEVIDPVEELE